MDVKVDTNAVRDVAHRMEQIVEELSGTDFRHADEGAVHNGRVSVALDDFCDTWEVTGRRLLQELHTAVGHLNRTADEIERADHHLAREQIQVPLIGTNGRGGGGGANGHGGSVPTVGSVPTGGSMGDRAVQAAEGEARAHVVEQGGDNRGERVGVYQRAAGSVPGAPWCASFVTWALMQGGWKKPPGNWAYVPNWVRSARAGQSGMSVVSDADARPGDAIAYDWNGDGVYDHIGLVTGPRQANGGIPSVEGNTHGGGVEGVYDKLGGKARGARNYVIIRVSQ